jgi:hypothetical protein
VLVKPGKRIPGIPREQAKLGLEHGRGERAAGIPLTDRRTEVSGAPLAAYAGAGLGVKFQGDPRSASSSRLVIGRDDVLWFPDEPPRPLTPGGPRRRESRVRFARGLSC